jgi:hypothetical protein
MESDPKTIPPSFFMGPPGIYTLGALIHSYTDTLDSSNVDKYVGKVLGFANLFEAENHKYLEDEVLYGSAGYLYCLLLLR